MKTKILLIEHDPATIIAIQQALKRGNVNYTAKTVQSEIEFEKAIFNFKPDIILSNYSSPTFDWMAAFTIKERLAPHTPFIFVSESIGEEKAVELIKKGATDFVLKERLETLADKINRALDEVNAMNLKAKHNQSEEKKNQGLFQSETKFHAFFGNSMDGMLLTVTDGQILAANPAACEIFHMTEQEIIDAGRLGLVDRTDPRLKLLLEERQRTGSAKGEITLLHKEGSSFPGELSSVMFKNTNGEQRTCMIVRDITQRKETEQQLFSSANESRQTLNNLNKILDSSLDLICTIDKEGKFVSASNASEHILGYRPIELIGKNYIDFVFPEDAIKTLDVETNIQRGMQVTMFENRYVHKDGHIVPMLWSSRWDETEQLNYAIGKDATEKKNLEKAVKMERQRFMDLYSQAPSSMGILKGPNHVYEMVNPLYLQLIDKQEDIIGKTVREVLPELEPQDIFNFLDVVYQTGQTFSANEMLLKFDRHENGQLVDTYLNLIYQPHRNLEGNVDGIFFFGNDVTEQVISRKVIEESEKKYRELIENLPIATYSCDAEGHIIMYNKAATALWGREPEKGKDKWCGSYTIYSVDGELIPHESSPMAIALREGKAEISKEIILKRPNGEKRYVIPHPVPFIDNEGRITGAVNVLTDITENKQIQRILKKSEKKYRQIVETAQEGIWLIDENHQTTFVNNEMCQILEYTPKEMMGKEIYSFMDKEGQRIAAKILKRKLEGKSDKQHFKYIAKSGKEIWTNITATPLFNELGVYNGSLAMVTDITEMKKVQRTLKRNEKKYRYLFENNPMPMWITELNTFKFLDVNKMAIEQYGYSEEEFLSMTALEIRPEQDKFDKSFESKPEKFNRGIWNHQKKDGTIIQVEIIAHKIIYEGVPARFILSNDITDRRKAELNLEEQNKQLVKTNTELDRFVYSVSHDLRSPLTSVLGILSFIEGESEEPQTLKHAEMIHRSIDRLDEFIKNILIYSRNNRTGLEIEKIAIQERTLAIINSLQSMEEANEIHYEVDIQQEESFYSDSLRFNTIMENLISNAIKHHKKCKSGRYIKITGQCDHEKLQLSIEDNGIGIAPENHQKIFDMFFRISSETDGSGIGLYIVKDAVEKIQGTVEVKSEKEIGTTFFINLKNLQPWKLN